VVEAAAYAARQHINDSRAQPCRIACDTAPGVRPRQSRTIPADTATGSRASVVGRPECMRTSLGSACCAPPTPRVAVVLLLSLAASSDGYSMSPEIVRRSKGFTQDGTRCHATEYAGQHPGAAGGSMDGRGWHQSALPVDGNGGGARLPVRYAVGAGDRRP
jgi:hypothetical protein